MLKRVTCAFTVVLLLFASSLAGQNLERCATNNFLEQSLLIHPELVSKRAAFLRNQALRIEKGFISNRSISIIPVVVHIVYNSDEQNISAEQVRSQIASINRDFRLKNENVEQANANFKQLAADVTIEFCLADKDPDGNTSNGITRSKTPEDQIGLKSVVGDGRKAIFYSEFTGYDAWNPKKYLNIWVCELGNGVLGYAAFPESTVIAEDGIVVDYRSFGSQGTAKHPSNLGKTLTHEIGHYLDLQHIWGNTIGDCEVDDGIEDTPPQERPTGGCPITSQVSCSSFDMFNNYMDYCNDECLSIFTPDQVKRMLATLNSVRSGLLNTNNCSLVSLDNPLSEIQLWGNPATKEFTLHLDQGSLFEVTVSGYNLLGQQVLADKKYFFPADQTINIEFLPQGIYLIKLSTSDSQVVKKIIVSK